MPTPRLRTEHTALLVIDMQEKLLPVMRDPQNLVGAVGRLIDGAHVLRMPVLVTEQYRKGLGDTVSPIAQRLGAALCRVEKLKFSAMVEPVRAILTERRIRHVIVCGIEAHVCVLQSCLDLLDAGYITAVATDAVSSRREVDQAAAMLRLAQAGAIATTVESALFELTHEAGTERFKQMLGVIK
jgi:nicotinamidase-related amidase